MLKKMLVRNFKSFRSATIELGSGLNVLVGSNEAGKSTLVEAIYLALTARVGTYPIALGLTPHLLNIDSAAEYLKRLHDGELPDLPEIIIELYLDDLESHTPLKGTNNILREDSPGVRLWIRFDDGYSSEYEELLKDPTKIRSIPIEYYRADWLAFSGTPISQRSLKVSASLIDASKIRLKSGTDYYLQKIIKDSLTDAERVRLARAYADLKDSFAECEGINAINIQLDKRKAEITDKVLSLSMDASPSAAWESSLVPHLDSLPFDNIGGGEQATLKILLALTRKIDGSQVVLIEEPENHLAYTRLNQLIGKVSEHCAERQVVVTTHSSFVLNKLGLRNLLLLKSGRTSRISNLPEETQRYFKKLPGYDTLRMVLADHVILVEGASDELIVQRAFRDRHGKLPAEKGVDVITIRGLSFTRFLDIAVQTGTRVEIVTDNDGNAEAVMTKFAPYLTYPHLQLHVSTNNELPSLEPQIVEVNALETLNAALGRSFVSKEDLLNHVAQPGNKTETALKIFESTTRLTMPEYIAGAVDV